jgi:hypothetical protein
VKTYRICLDGCDDSTCFDIDLTDDELEVVKKLEKLSKETSTYGCMPTLEIGKGESNGI